MALIESNSPVIAIVIFIVIAGAGAWFIFGNTSSSSSMYTLSLNQSDNGFSGSFNVPNDISLSNENYTFFVNYVSYKNLGAPLTEFYDLEFLSPDNSCNITMSVDSSNNARQTTFSNCNFVGKDGAYSFKVTPSQTSIVVKLASVDVDIRKVK